MRRTPSQSLLGSALILYLVADAAAAQSRLDLAGALIAILAGALSLSPMLAARAESVGKDRVGWLGLCLGCALVRLSAPLGLSLVVDVAHVLGLAASSALLLDLALSVPDQVGPARRIRLARRLGYALCALAAIAGLCAYAPAFELLGAVWVAPAWLAHAPFGALLLALCGSFGWRSLRPRLGSSPEALAENSWAMLGLAPAVLLALLLTATGLFGLQPLLPVVRVAVGLTACGLVFGHLRMLDPARRLSAAPVTREAIAGALTVLLVAMAGAALRGAWPETGFAASAAIGATLLSAALLWKTLRDVSYRLWAPVSGRLLRALEHAHAALAEANSLDDVARVVLGAARAASGNVQGRPLLQLFAPALQLSIDAAGQPHATEQALHPEIERALRLAPGEVLARAPLQAQIVRAPALRPLVDALCGLDALCVLPLSLDAELCGALLLTREDRLTRLTLEELEALRRFGRQVAGFLAVLASDARAQQRATQAFAAAEQAERARAEAERAVLRLAAEARAQRVGGSEERMALPLVAYSPAMRGLLARLRALAASEVPVLFLAERGVPVAPLAQLLHSEGGRGHEALVIGECAALRAEHGTAALLGCAQKKSPGWLAVAAHGTLLLCDLPALAQDAQHSLAEALLSRHARPIDADEPYPCNARLVASSRIAPDALVALGALHPLLRERLSLVLRVPPLRERPEDLPSLLLYALDHSTRVLGRPAVGLDEAAQAVLLAHCWPGNLDELETVIEHAVAHCRGSRVSLDDLPQLGPLPNTVDRALLGSLEDVERRVLQQALEQASGNKSEAARMLGLKRSTFFDKLRRHGLDDGEKDSSAPN